MVGPCDFDRVKSNEAYMLVYTLKQAALPAPTKQPSLTPVHSSTQQGDKQLKEVKAVAIDSKPDQIKPLLVKNHTLADVGKKDTREEESHVQTQNAVKQQQSNGATLDQPKKEVLKPVTQNLTIEAPALKKTVSEPAAHPLFGKTEHPLFGKAAHPLFGSLAPAQMNTQTIEVPAGPCWYVNGGDSQLQKRKPDDLSSRNSSTKKLVKPLHSGLQRLKKMNKKIKLLGNFASLRVSRVASAEFPDRSQLRQGLVADMRA